MLENTVLSGVGDRSRSTCGSSVLFGTTVWMITSTAGSSDSIGVAQEKHGGRFSTIYWLSGVKILHQLNSQWKFTRKYSVYIQCIYTVNTMNCMESRTLYIQSVYTVDCIYSVFPTVDCICSVYALYKQCLYILYLQCIYSPPSHLLNCISSNFKTISMVYTLFIQNV